MALGLRLFFLFDEFLGLRVRGSVLEFSGSVVFNRSELQEFWGSKSLRGFRV